MDKKFGYLISADQKEAVQDLIIAISAFFPSEDVVTMADLVLVTTDDAHIAAILDQALVNRQMSLTLSGEAAPTSETIKAAPKITAKTESNGNQPGVCLGCGGPTWSKRTKWCAKLECKNKQKASWQREAKVAPAPEVAEAPKEELHTLAPDPFGQLNQGEPV